MRPFIRPQTVADDAAVQDLIAAAFAGDRPPVGETTSGETTSGETTSGHPTSGDAHTAAADAPVEVALNAALLRDPAIVPALTLVADSAGRIVGQVTSSRGVLTVADGSSRPVVGVGPVSVLPGQQGQGIGSALMTALIEAAGAAGEPALVLLGSPAFYGRFGFVPAADLGIQSPDPAWGGYFQALRLGSPDVPLAGRFRYATPFDAL